MIEPFNLTEFKQIPIGSRVVWNSRDLKTGGKKKETFAQARKLWSGWLCQASFIKTVNDIKSGVNAVLVGTHLKDFAKCLEPGSKYFICSLRESGLLLTVCAKVL